MKKKGTRKVRKNKRTTQRRKNRSYKRMRGGVYNFKSRGVFASKMHIPQNVKDMIDKYEGIDDSRMGELQLVYDNAINTKDQETLNFYTQHTSNIKEYIRTFTKSTEDDRLMLLPISTTDVEILINNLKEVGFLPTSAEFKVLFDKFYGRNGNKSQKGTKHANPYKFNGLALAVILVITFINNKIKGIVSQPLTPHMPSIPDKTIGIPDAQFGVLQSYLFELGPTDKLFWKTISPDTPVTANPVCPFRGRIRYIKYGDSESPVTNKNINWLKYLMKACDPKDAGPLLSSYFTMMNRSAELVTANKPGETTSVTYKLHVAPDTLPPDGDKFREPKYKMYVSRIEIKYIDMTDFEKKSQFDCPPMSSYIEVTVITIYEYDEDGMINKVLVTYKFFEITTSKPDCKSLTNRYGQKINLNDRVYREVVTDMETKLKLRVRPSKTLEGMLEHDTVTRIKITAKRGDTYTQARPLVYTLYMTHTPHTHWTARPASVIQNNAFNAVNDYIRTHEWIMSNPVKRFLIENNDDADKISVVIEVNELTAENTLKRATYCGEEMSEYELFDTIENAQINAAAKLANYNWTTANGPIGF